MILLLTSCVKICVLSDSSNSSICSSLTSLPAGDRRGERGEEGKGEEVRGGEERGGEGRGGGERRRGEGRGEEGRGGEEREGEGRLGYITLEFDDAHHI